MRRARNFTHGINRTHYKAGRAVKKMLHSGVKPMSTFFLVYFLLKFTKVSVHHTCQVPEGWSCKPEKILGYYRY